MFLLVPRPDGRQLAWAGRSWLGALLACGLAQASEPTFRYDAPIIVQRPGAYVQLPLPPSVYAHAMTPGLADLRIVDARGQRVPYAMLPPPSPAARAPVVREVRLYPLPSQRAASGDWALPVTVQVMGTQIQVQPKGVAAAASGGAASPPPGWLFDLGEAVQSESAEAVASRRLVLAWSAPAEFSASYDLQTSPDLRRWSSADSGQLMALAAPSGALTQPQVPLPSPTARFARLVWHDPTGAPQLTAARVETLPAAAAAQDAGVWLAFTPALVQDNPPARDMVFDLGGPLPITQVDVTLGMGTRVLPARIDGRADPQGPWQPLAQGVFYRLERDGQLSVSPPWALQAAWRYLRVVPDERAGALPAQAVRLRVQATMPSLVFAAQGEPPFTLKAGSPQAPAGALPAAVLVPALADERPRFGLAQLGDWVEQPAVAREMVAAQQRAAWRPWLLWGVLLLGVAGLAGMVWRLRRVPGTTAAT